MFRRIRKFLDLSRQEQWLLIEVFCLTGIVRLAILVLPFRWLSMILGKHMQESSMCENAATLVEAKQVGWAVETVSRYTPWESKCLVQATVGKILLRQRSIANTLYLGVVRDEDKGLVAHAWLRCGKTILIGGQGREKFTVVGQFVDDGGCR